MFKIDQSETFTWPVEVMIAADGGKFEKSSFDAVFKRCSQDRLEEVARLVAADKMTDRDVCLEMLVGWSGVTDSGTDVPFTKGTLERVLSIPGVARSISRTFVNAHTGNAVKN